MTTKNELRNQTNEDSNDEEKQSSKFGIISKLSSAKEKGSYTGFLSYSAEWHALAIGFGIGTYYPEMIQPFMAYILGKGGAKSMSSDQHIQDAKNEPVYAILGIAIAKGMKNPQMVLSYF